MTVYKGKMKFVGASRGRAAKVEAVKKAASGVDFSDAIVPVKLKKKPE